MRTCLGAAAELRCVEQLPAGWADGAALVHVEGYILYKPALARDALRAARQAGALVSPVAPCSAECSTSSLDNLFSVAFCTRSLPVCQEAVSARAFRCVLF